MGDLKDYLSSRYGGREKKKRKKKKRRVHGSGLKIIDENRSAEKIWDDGHREASKIQHENERNSRTTNRPEDNVKKDIEVGISAMMQDGSGWNTIRRTKKTVNGRRQRHDSDSDQDVRRVSRSSSSDQEIVNRKSRSLVSYAQDSQEDSDQEVVRRPTSSQSSRRSQIQSSDMDLEISREPSTRAKRSRHDSDSDIDIPSQKRTAVTRKRYDSDSDIDIPSQKRTAETRKRHSSSSHSSRRRRTGSEKVASKDTSSRSQSSGKRRRYDSDSDQEIVRTRPPSARGERKLKQIKEDSDSDQDLSVRLVKHRPPGWVEKSESKEGKEQTVYRDKEGKKVTKEQAERPERKWTTKMDWGSGLVQKRLINAHRQPQQSEQTQKAIVDSELRDRQRDQDPMREWASKKASNKEVKKTSKLLRPMFQGLAPENRFGILPGYRWNGKDYTNGFERRYLKEMNIRVDRRRKYHKWSTENM